MIMFKKMLSKILIGVLMIAAVVVILSFIDLAPAEPTASSEITKDFTAEDFSIFDVITFKNISLGMTKEQVDEILGKSTVNEREYSQLLEYDYSGLYVIYRNNKVVNLRVNKHTSKDSFRFQSARSVGIGDSAEDVLIKYNNMNIGESWIGCTLYGDKIISESEADKYDSEKVHLLYFAKDTNDKIYLITIMDYKNRITQN